MSRNNTPFHLSASRAELDGLTDTDRSASVVSSSSTSIGSPLPRFFDFSPLLDRYKKYKSDQLIGTLTSCELGRPENTSGYKGYFKITFPLGSSRQRYLLPEAYAQLKNDNDPFLVDFRTEDERAIIICGKNREDALVVYQNLLSNNQNLIVGLSSNRSPSSTDSSYSSYTVTPIKR